MPGGEIVVVGAAAAKGMQATEEVLEGSPKDRDSVRKAMQGTRGLEVAGNAKADRLAARQLTINKIMKPLFWFSNYQSQYFRDQFEEDLAEKLTEVPEENIQAPAPIVAAQAMEGLSFSFSEADLKELYLNLIRTASDDRAAQHAHPSFASIIKCLTPAEARLVQIVLGRPEDTPASEIRWKNTDGSFIARIRHVLDLHDTDVSMGTNQRVFVPELEAYVSNWVRLGLVNMDYTKHRASSDAYDWVEKRPEYIEEQNSAKQVGWEVTFEKGLLVPTAFGRQFYAAVKPTNPEIA